MPFKKLMNNSFLSRKTISQAKYGLLFCLIIFISFPITHYPTLSSSKSYVNQNAFYGYGIIAASLLSALLYKQIYGLSQFLSRFIFFSFKSEFQKYLSMTVFFGLFFIFLSNRITDVLCYINQYNVNSPLYTEETKIDYKEKRSGKGSINYHFYIKLLNHIQEINPEALTADAYENIQPGDKVIAKIQKGNLGKYFAKEIVIDTNSKYYKLI